MEKYKILELRPILAHNSHVKQRSTTSTSVLHSHKILNALKDIPNTQILTSEDVAYILWNTMTIIHSLTYSYLILMNFPGNSNISVDVFIFLFRILDYNIMSYIKPFILHKNPHLQKETLYFLKLHQGIMSVLFVL